jgi:hypothetical protein
MRLSSADGLNFKKQCEGKDLASLATSYNIRLASSEIVTENTHIAEHIPVEFI